MSDGPPRRRLKVKSVGAGWFAKTIQSTLGHMSASFTLTVYCHLFETDIDELAAALESPPRRKPVSAPGRALDDELLIDAEADPVLVGVLREVGY